MTPEQRIAALEAELAEARRVIAHQAQALAEHAVREAQETAKREARARINRKNYERRKAAKEIQTSDSDRIQTLNQAPPSSPLCPPSPSSNPSPSSPLYPPFSPQKALSAEADLQVDDLPDATADAQPVLLQVEATPPERPEDLQALWNAEAHHSLPRWQGMSAERRRRAAARLRERPLAQWLDVIRRLSASSFCRGEEGGGWRASPDWILQPATADKVLEGTYDRPGRPAAAAAVGEECAACSRVGDGANLQQPGGERLWLGYACGCCGGWTEEVHGGRHYAEVYEWARERRAGRAA